MPSNAFAIHHLPASQVDRQPFNWGELTWFASRALANSNELTVGRCVLKPGEQNPLHRHPNCSEVLVVLSGRIRHTITEGGEIELGPDDTVVIPPNIRHRASNIGTTDAVLLIVFSSADRETIGE